MEERAAEYGTAVDRGKWNVADNSNFGSGNHEVSVDRDAATHRCYLQAQHIRAAATGGPNYIVAGRYEDRFVRADAGWRIAHRTLTVMWTDGNVGVARGD